MGRLRDAPPARGQGPPSHPGHTWGRRPPPSSATWKPEGSPPVPRSPGTVPVSSDCGSCAVNSFCFVFVFLLKTISERFSVHSKREGEGPRFAQPPAPPPRLPTADAPARRHGPDDGCACTDTSPSRRAHGWHRGHSWPCTVPGLGQMSHDTFPATAPQCCPFRDVPEWDPHGLLRRAPLTQACASEVPPSPHGRLAFQC